MINKELKELYENYAEGYNRLSKIMQKANIDIGLLIEFAEVSRALYTHNAEWVKNEPKLPNQLAGGICQ